MSEQKTRKKREVPVDRIIDALSNLSLENKVLLLKHLQDSIEQEKQMLQEKLKLIS